MAPDIRAVEPSLSPDASSSRDAALVAAACAGDAGAFERLYRAHAAHVYGLCLRMTRRSDIAEDCTQQTFVRAWRALGKFQGRSALRTWLHRIAVNEVLSYGRNHGTRAESDDEAVETAGAEAQVPLRAARDTADVMDVERAIAALPEGSRHVLVLQAVYGYSHEETAGILGIAVGTCKAQLHRGRKLLRERLGLQEAQS